MKYFRCNVIVRWIFTVSLTLSVFAAYAQNNLNLTVNCNNSTLQITGRLSVQNRLNLQIFKDGAIVNQITDLVGPSINQTTSLLGSGSYFIRALEVNNDANNVTSNIVSGNCTGNPPPPPPPPPPTDFTLNPYSGDAYFINGVVSIGAGSVNDRSALLSVKGKIRAQEVRIENTNWPDYVFTPTYNLPSLPALETYLNTHHHLPGIPSAREVAEKGVLLGDMNARLLEKVEELTLHLIALEKRTRQQERELSRLRRKQATHLRSSRQAQ